MKKVRLKRGPPQNRIDTHLHLWYEMLRSLRSGHSGARAHFHLIFNKCKRAAARSVCIWGVNHVSVDVVSAPWRPHRTSGRCNSAEFPPARTFLLTRQKLRPRPQRAVKVTQCFTSFPCSDRRGHDPSSHKKPAEFHYTHTNTHCFIYSCIHFCCCSQLFCASVTPDLRDVTNTQRCVQSHSSPHKF